MSTPQTIAIMRTAILVLSLALLVPQAIGQSISFLSPSNSSSNVTFPQANHYDLYKNSHFTANCSFPFTVVANNRSNSSEVQTTFARSQSEFCAKLNPKVPWFIWPTRPTSAAYLPNWVSALLSLAILTFKFVRELSQWTERIAIAISDKSSNQLKVNELGMVIFLYNIGQSVVWWYGTISGFSDPLHTSWMDPIQWLTFSFYALSVWEKVQVERWLLEKDEETRQGDGETRPGDRETRKGDNENLETLIGSLFWCMLLAVPNYIAGLVYTSKRFRGDLGAGSYIPLSTFPELPANITSTCRNLLHDSASLLYSDPN